MSYLKQNEIYVIDLDFTRYAHHGKTLANLWIFRHDETQGGRISTTRKITSMHSIKRVRQMQDALLRRSAK